MEIIEIYQYCMYTNNIQIYVKGRFVFKDGINVHVCICIFTVCKFQTIYDCFQQLNHN